MMSAVTSRGEKELAQPPTDSVSAVRFGPTAANQLLVSSWDKVCIMCQDLDQHCIVVSFVPATDGRKSAR